LISRAQGCSEPAFVHQEMQHFVSRASPCPRLAGADGTRRVATAAWWCVPVHHCLLGRCAWPRSSMM
jgi:hypothetical protein